MTTLAFCDTETTGLDADRHEVWEVAVVLDTGGTVTEHAWQLPVDLSKADPDALRIGKFYERINLNHFGMDRRSFAADFAKLTFGAILIGANPGFDERFLTRLLRSNGACPGFHYRPICITTLAAGYLMGQRDIVTEYGIPTIEDHSDEQGGSYGFQVIEASAPALAVPWKSDDIARAVGVNPDNFERHSALGDARWAQAVYSAVMGVRHPTPKVSTGLLEHPLRLGEA